MTLGLLDTPTTSCSFCNSRCTHTVLQEEISSFPCAQKQNARNVTWYADDTKVTYRHAITHVIYTIRHFFACFIYCISALKSVIQDTPNLFWWLQHTIKRCISTCFYTSYRAKIFWPSSSDCHAFSFLFYEDW